MGFRETWADISLDALSENYEMIKKISQKDVLGVVKANAYGHGDAAIAKHLVTLGCELLCVSSLDEALGLQEAGVTQDILIFSYVNVEAIQKYGSDQFIYTIPSMAWYHQLEGIDQPLRLHLEVNTGMNRYGLKSLHDIETIIAKHHVEGIYTHFQSPDNLDEGKRQLTQFKKVVDALSINIPWVHVGNAPTELIKDEAWIRGIRVGLGLYGYRTDFPELKPVLSLYSTILYDEEVLPGETVGYDYTYAVTTPQHIGTIPIGYADGFDVRNAAAPVWIHNQPYDIVGKICMDQTMIRIDDTVSMGDVVELIGPNRTCKVIDKATGIMTYIQPSTLSDRIERRYTLQGKHVLTTVR